MPTFHEFNESDHPALEREILDRWERYSVFNRSIETREGADTFSFYEGPPTANGRPGIHHVLARTIKDCFCRYKTIKGFKVERKAGWDTHGLPVEIEVEKELGLTGRDQIKEFGLERYNAACRESVLKYKELWDTLTTRMGYWVDLENPYVTFTNEYIESVWWLLKQIHEKGLLYKGHKIQWYSPGSGTVLSSHEVSLGYREVQDPSVYIKFPVAGQEGTYFLAWTTTPWTLISNAALAVADNIDYVTIEVQTDDGQTERLILAEKRLSVVKDEYKVLETRKGKDLVGLKYHPLYDYFVKDAADFDDVWSVVSATYVTTSDGTGIVHTAPAFGAEDFSTAGKYQIPVLNPVNPDGTFNESARLVSGMWFKDADKVISKDLRARNLLFRHETYLHNYPHDWRKGTPLVSYPVESWFIQTTRIKDELVANNATINWQPAGVGTGRFGEWLENNVDWALSRNRFWGTPLPIWCSDVEGSTHIEVIGSLQELKSKCGETWPGDDEVDLHRPYVDELTWPSPDGGTMRRVPDLIDVWFDSGAMPFAQWHYPFENEDKFEATFPADFIAEGVDQTRGWFYTLHAIAGLVKGSVAYRNVVVNGLILDENGEKMSKSKGNTVDPFETIGEHGADVVRWYMMSNAPPWENLKFSGRGLLETRRKFFSTLANVYGFFATYANIDDFDLSADPVPIERRAELDRWILSRTATTVAAVDEAMDSYNPTRAARAVEQLVDDLSNWYIRRSRRRFWKSDEEADDKRAAYQTVHDCLLSIAVIMSPIAPFFSERLYLLLTPFGEEDRSVHLESYPSPDPHWKDDNLEERINVARIISSIVLGLRNDCGVNVRQPLARLMVVTSDRISEDLVESVKGIILSEVNIKNVEYIDSSSSIVSRTAKPDFKRLGKRLGPLMKTANAAIRAMSDDDIDSLLNDGSFVFQVDDSSIQIEPDDIEILSEGVHGWLVGQDAGITVALDVEITDDLLNEGYARETVNRIQNLRKQAGFDVTDRIRVTYRASKGLHNAFSEHAEWIRNETLALELQDAENPDGELVETFELENESLTLGVQRLN
ncbi:MAG: isoleucine--tRNA ligase [Rhodothermales bacterium]|nr:isoleucine--tRNA ligase [Rhodothermales bacterium]